MKRYVVVTGLLFATLVVLHIARVVLEGTWVLREPVFLGSTVASAAMCGWAWRLLFPSGRR